MDSLPSQPVPKCSRANPCTELLLDDPRGVLRDRSRWPTHLCYPVMIESCRRWAAENDPQRAGEYPLPLAELDERRALLAVRVRSRRSTLDLFALEGYVVPGVDDNRYYVGELAFVLRGREDTSLFDLARRADRWWRGLSHVPPRGRPPDSGFYPTLEDFEREVLRALRELRAAGERPIQRKVAARLGLSYLRTRELLVKLREERGSPGASSRRFLPFSLFSSFFSVDSGNPRL